MDGTTKLTDILDLECLQTLQDTFAQATKTTTVIVDPEGRQITSPSNWNGFCGLFFYSPIRQGDCCRTITKMLARNRQCRGLVIERCPHTDLGTAALPIFLDEVFLGSWIFGQIRLEPLSSESIEQIAQKLALPIEEVHQLLEDLPTRTEQEQKDMGSFLEAFSKLVVDLGHRNQEIGRHASNLRYAGEELAQTAFFDHVTGLPNAKKLAQDLKATRGGASGQFLVCFHPGPMHSFHDIYGRDRGHALLHNIAEWIAAQNFKQSTLYRGEGYGLCLLIEDSNTEWAIAHACEIRERFAKPWLLPNGEEEISLRCDATVSVIRMNERLRSTDIFNLIDRTLMLAHKNETIFFYDEETDRKANEWSRIDLALKHCVRLDMKGFQIHYQPIVDVRTGVWKGLEALCRWDCPARGPIPPEIFVAEAERLGLIGTIGEWVLETAIAQCKAYSLDRLEGFFLSVNISPMQLMGDDFFTRVAYLLAKYNYPGDKLSLEVAENARYRAPASTESVIEDLRRLDVKIALDGFEAGYPSFIELKARGLHFLKTRRSVITDIEEDPQLQHFYFIISEMAHLGAMQLIAMGVETHEQLEIVKENGADYIQGYFFSKPLPVGVLGMYLDRFSCPDHTLRHAKSKKENSKPPAVKNYRRKWSSLGRFIKLGKNIEIIDAIRKPKTLRALIRQIQSVTYHFPPVPSGAQSRQAAPGQYPDRGSAGKWPVSGLLSLNPAIDKITLSPDNKEIFML